MEEEKKKVLLIEPDYNNKFPPVGLMKLATYYRNLGNWEVVFYKGDLKLFVIERIVDKLADDLNVIKTDMSTDWRCYRYELFEFIKTRKSVFLDNLPIDHFIISFQIKKKIYDAKDYYWKGLWEKNPEWDRVGVTTLFTFYWDKTIETIEFAKKLVKDTKNIMIGGVLASIQPNEIEQATGIKPYVGLLNQPGILDKGDKQIIDELELDYSILDEIDYEYPMANAYYRYTTRGCIRKCPFCAVSILEPVYNSYIPLKKSIDSVTEKYGPQKDLLLMDNNVLASKDFTRIIKEIQLSGFKKGAIFQRPNLLELSINNLKKGINDKAYTQKAWKLILSFCKTIKTDKQDFINKILEKYHLFHMMNATKENILLVYDEIKELYNAHFNSGKGTLRYVDFNQGLDARLFSEEKARLLSTIAIKPLRIAFDDIKTKDEYEKAIRMCASYGLKDFSNYLLYNYQDQPDDLYKRLKININLCEMLGIRIYSFPMKYHPIRKTNEMNEDYSHNRDYVGKHWNRKYIRAIQAILNSTKGKIGRGKEFFEKAFGKNLKEYHYLLDMPETMIIYRLFFEWLGSPEGHKMANKILGSEQVCKKSTVDWKKTYDTCKERLSKTEWNSVIDFIHKNDFSNKQLIKSNKAKKLLDYYYQDKQEILKFGTDLFKMKQEYEINYFKGNAIE